MINVYFFISVSLDAKLSGEFVELLLVVGGHFGGLTQVFVVLLDGDLVVHALGLVDLHLLQHVVGFLNTSHVSKLPYS